MTGSLKHALNSWREGSMFTGQSSDTRRLVVAISLSGSAVSFSLTGEKRQNTKHTWETETAARPFYWRVPFIVSGSYSFNTCLTPRSQMMLLILCGEERIPHAPQSSYFFLQHFPYSTKYIYVYMYMHYYYKWSNAITTCFFKLTDNITSIQYILLKNHLTAVHIKSYLRYELIMNLYNQLISELIIFLSQYWFHYLNSERLRITIP